VVSRKFKVSVDDMIGGKRNQELALPRQIAMYLSRELTSASLPCIGRAFGGRDHSTVLHSIHKIKKLIVSDQRMADTVAEIGAELRNGKSKSS